MNSNKFTFDKCHKIAMWIKSPKLRHVRSVCAMYVLYGMVHKLRWYQPTNQPVPVIGKYLRMSFRQKYYIGYVHIYGYRKRQFIYLIVFQCRRTKTKQYRYRSKYYCHFVFQCTYTNKNECFGGAAPKNVRSCKRCNQSKGVRRLPIKMRMYRDGDFYNMLVVRRV